MIIIRSPEKMRSITDSLHRKGKSVGFVPTMGALHQGHLSLIRQARLENDRVVVSIFVNPVQFGYNEDFARYPRDLQKDSSLCRKAGVDYLFYPGAKDIYPAGFKSYVCVEGLSDILCGFYRPGHFRGVATVVAKLFNIVAADKAYFGQKDAQQAVIIARLAEDLNFPVKIRVLPTVRESGGLAMSSRNAYLSPAERQKALVIPRSLKKAQELVKKGVRGCSRIAESVKEVLVSADPQSIDYVAIVDPRSLQPLNRINKQALLLVAVKIGKARLIDNIILKA